MSNTPSPPAHETQMPDQSALKIAAAFLDAWTRGDFEKARTYLADDYAFDGPISHYRSADDFIAGSKDFAKTTRPGWNRIAAFGDGREALLLYDLVLRSGASMRIADHHQVKDGKIQTETILWDTHGHPARG